MGRVKFAATIVFLFVLFISPYTAQSDSTSAWLIAAHGRLLCDPKADVRISAPE